MKGQKNISNLKPDFEFDKFGINAEDLKAEAEKYATTEIAFEHKAILEKLSNEIHLIDFEILIRPEIAKIREEMKKIESTDVVLHPELFPKKSGANKFSSRYGELEAKLNELIKSIKQKHYVVCIISELLKIADNKKWNLCKCYDYVYVYNSAYWKQLSKDDLKYFLGDVAVKFGYPEIDAMHHLFKDELLKQFLTQAHLPTPEVDPNKISINLKNGTFEFTDKGWNLRPFDPKDFLTYQLPFEYDESAVCPLFDTFLEKVLPDADSRIVLQEFSGFVFSKINLEKCMLLAGAGQNGKSVYFNVYTALLGRENVLTYPLGLFNHEYNRAKLTNVLLNYSSEKGSDLNPDMFKALVSGEPVQAREPYGKPFTINNKVKFILNTNELPRETESTEAYFRRFIIIPFDVKISDAEKDIHLADKIISNELPGVFNWLLVGLSRLVAQQKFTESEKINNALSEFKKQADSVALFLDEFHYKPSTNGQRRPLAELYEQYKKFCFDDGYKATGKNKFSVRLENKGFVKDRTNIGTYFELRVDLD